MSRDDGSVPHIITHIDRYLVAFSAEQVIEMVSMPEISSVPGLPPTLRGMIRVRDSMLPLIDTRNLFGLPSCKEAFEEMTTMLRTRRQDHEQWLKELEATVHEDRPFTLATDPHKCGFGRWYDQFRTDHLLLASHMRAFDAPHKAIHKIAHEVVELTRDGHKDRALEIVERARVTVLASLVDLFAGAESLVRDAFNEIAVLIEAGGRSFAIAVDSVETLEAFEMAALEPADQHGTNRSTGLVAFARRSSGSLCLVLDPDILATSAGLGRRGDLSPISA